MDAGRGTRVKKNPKRHLLIIVREEGHDDVVLVDSAGHDFTMSITNELGEIRSNQRVAAMMAGASVEDWMKLPGEQVASVLYGRDIDIHLRENLYQIGEFKEESW